jgi:hypothetical protein
MKHLLAKKILKRVLLVILLVFIGLQFTSPSLKNPPVEAGHDLMATNSPPPEVAALLRRACYDCHSHETRWPWYARVSPVSNWIVKHMTEGRNELNFSEWSHEDAYRAGEDMAKIAEEVQEKKMPLPSYTWMGMHPEARLTEEERGRLVKWAEQEAQRLSQQ